MNFEELQSILGTFNLLEPIAISAITKLLHRTSSREELIQASLDLADETRELLQAELAKLPPAK